MGALNSLFVLIPALLFIGILHWRNKKIHQHLKALANDVGQLNRDTQLHTPIALSLSVLKALPGVVMLLALGFWLSHSSLAISEFIGSLSKQLALFWLVFGTIYQMLLPGGVSERHFHLSSARCAQYRQLIYRLGLALLPLIYWGVLGQTDPLYLNEDVIGQWVMLLTFGLLAVLIFPIFRNAWREKSASSIRLVLVTLMALIPLCLMGLTAKGYFYTALCLGTRWLDSLYLILLWGVVYTAAIRGLSVAAQRLTYRRASVRQQQTVAREGGDCVESEDEEPLAIERINHQSLRLTSMVLLLIFGTCFYWIWADLVTVITYLDSVALWHSNSGTGSHQTLQTVTLGSIIFATFTLVIAYILMRNLPGLLEVLVLSRFSLRQGSSYAITTILSYLIIVLGIMVFFASLGVSWDKLQWLAAALSVGLGFGFGLQEIFGNFISGLIILFERPVRIGDTITIGNFSGTVNKIRIRATTITDFDRKEVIIPNKAFVTERLINWSLSDTTTRIIIKLGVAYGSDLKKVREILLKAAKENPRVMTDPQPQVFFLAFGASTLDHELRLFVRELIDRSYVVDELNRHLDQLCRENGIGIAFNQLEVYLHPSQEEGTGSVAKNDSSFPSLS